MTRREAREHVFRMLFAYDFSKKDEESLKEQAGLYFTHEGGDEIEYPPVELSEKDMEMLSERFAAIASKLPSIDEAIDRVSAGWKTSRMARADLSVLRLAVYEIIYDDQIPSGVAINEAVILAKKYGGDDSGSFVNGILGKMERLRARD